MSEIARNQQVRRAALEDAPALSLKRLMFWRDQISKGLLDIPFLEPDALLASTTALIRRPRASTLVAESAGAIVGYVTGSLKLVPGVKEPAVAVIEELLVDHAYGDVTLGLTLMRSAIEDLTQLGAKRIQARVLEKNTAAKRFHELCGFNPNLVYYEYDLSGGE